MNNNVFKNAPVFALLMASMLLTACASSPPQKSTDAVAKPQPAEAEVVIEPWDGDGMEIPLDGSSMEAWNTSLARVKAHTTPANYTTLTKSIEYLLVYDLAAQRDMNKLIARLDGLTGYEVVQRISWRKPAPGKGPAEKGAADAKIIDS